MIPKSLIQVSNKVLWKIVKSQYLYCLLMRYWRTFGQCSIPTDVINFCGTIAIPKFLHYGGQAMQTFFVVR